MRADPCGTATAEWFTPAPALAGIAVVSRGSDPTIERSGGQVAKVGQAMRHADGPRG